MGLENLSLEELNIVKQNAHQYLAKLERIQGGNMSWTDGNEKDYNYINLRSWANYYNLIEIEMNNRIVDIINNGQVD
jgi:hypothetical protein